MGKAKIKMVYRQVIDESCSSAFEKAIFQASYDEFLLKSQAYNREGKFKTFSKIKANDGRANSLHYKLSFSVGHFIAQLNNKIPVIKDNRGNKIAFEAANFEVIESHIEDISLHKVAINYETGLLSLIEIMGEYLLLCTDDLPEHGPIDTFVLRMQPDLSIVSFEEVDQPQIVLSAS
ncbi:MAG: hypothetical protein JST50_13510 [Bacteroidetes bacterium]|jgi:hypothetical protein|nr:hypothetical protein [Bacteroidota bacterium]